MSKWVGESEKAVRELFKKARQVAPSIVFLDEIDSIAPPRGTDVGTHVTDSVVNQLLTSIDGLESMEGVVVIGATNRPDIIDPGLLRPGRFDRLVLIRSPDKKARFEIFKIHTRGMPLSFTKEDVKKIEKDIESMSFSEIEEEQAYSDVMKKAVRGEPLSQEETNKLGKIPYSEKDTMQSKKKESLLQFKTLSDTDKLRYWLAAKTEDYSGADIEVLCREAAMLAIREDDKADVVKKVHFEKAMETVRASVTPNMMKFYEKVSETLGSGISKKDKSEKDIQYL
jgi:transitional endoplasmic reticulum ATPase